MTKERLYEIFNEVQTDGACYDHGFGGLKILSHNGRQFYCDVDGKISNL